MPANLLSCTDIAVQPTGPGPNPRTIGNAQFAVFDFAGSPHPNSQILGAPAGPKVMDAGHRLEIKFRRPVSAVCMSLFHTAQAPNVRFFSPAGSVVGNVTLATTQNVIQEVVASSKAIARIVVTSNANEARLVSLCTA